MAKRTADDDLLGMFSSMNMTSTAKREAVISKATKKPVEAKSCPVELMSQFLLLITENKMKEALLLTNQILEHEPKNKMVLEYKTYLRQYIQQGLDLPQEDEDAESDDEDDEEDGDEDEDDEDERSDDGSDEDERSDEREDEEEHKPNATAVYTHSKGPTTSAPKGSAASTSSTARRGREEAKGSGRPRDAKEVLTR